MGYDCTLHVVDPASIDRFAARFLGKGGKRSALDKRVDVEALFTQVRDAIAASPGSGARALLAALLLCCSAEAPHARSRNFALGLWSRYEADLGPPPPASLIPHGALREPLRPVLEAHPALAAALHTGFDGNYAVGEYVPPAAVPPLRAWLEARRAELLPRWQDLLDPLLLVLSVAEARGLGYWEATDLDVTQANEKWLDAARPKPDASVTTQSIPIPGSPYLMYAGGDRLVLSAALSDVTVIVDLSAERPRTRRIDDFFIRYAAAGEGGALHCVGRLRHQNPYRLYTVPLDGGAPREERSPFAGTELEEVFSAAGAIYLGARGGRPPERRRAGAWAPVAVQPLKDPITYSSYRFFAAPFDGEAALLVWGDQAYRVDGDALTPLPCAGLSPEVSIMSPLSCLREPSGALLLIDDRRLVTVDREGRREPVSDALENVMGFSPGPGDALVLWQGDTLEGDDVKILWREAGRVTRVPAKTLPKMRHLTWAGYLPSAHQLAVLEGARLHRVSWAAVAGLPSMTLDELRAHREKIEAKQRARKERDRA